MQSALRTICFLGAALLGTAACGAYQPPRVHQNVQLGLITGTVRDAHRNVPIRSANLYLLSARDTGWYRDPGFPLDSTQNVITDAEGRYRLAGLVPGQSRLVRMIGYIHQRHHLTVEPGDSLVRNFALDWVR
jgi:protocatechuate 3,4-dioxygenase beta subunit